MRKLLLMALVVCFSSYAKVGDKGNGGDVIVCFKGDNKIQLTNKIRKMLKKHINPFDDKRILNMIDNVKLLDFWEYDLDFKYEESSEDIYTDITNKIKKVSPNYYKKILKIEDQLRFQSYRSLPELRDEGIYPRIPSHCLIVQIAIQQNNDVVLYDSTFFEMLSEVDKAGLYLHEYLYNIAKKIGHEQSHYVRALNKFLFEKKYEAIDFYTELKRQKMVYDFHLKIGRKEDNLLVLSRQDKWQILAPMKIDNHITIIPEDEIQVGDASGRYYINMNCFKVFTILRKFHNCHNKLNIIIASDREVNFPNYKGTLIKGTKLELIKKSVSENNLLVKKIISPEVMKFNGVKINNLTGLYKEQRLKAKMTEEYKGRDFSIPLFAYRNIKNDITFYKDGSFSAYSLLLGRDYKYNGWRLDEKDKKRLGRKIVDDKSLNSEIHCFNMKIKDGKLNSSCSIDFTTYSFPFFIFRYNDYEILNACVSYKNLYQCKSEKSLVLHFIKGKLEIKLSDKDFTVRHKNFSFKNIKKTRAARCLSQKVIVKNDKLSCVNKGAL